MKANRKGHWRLGLLLGLLVQNIALLAFSTFKSQAAYADDPQWKFDCSYCYNNDGDLIYCCVWRRDFDCLNHKDCVGET